MFETPTRLARAGYAALRPVTDRSLLFSFDRVGFRLHALGFRDEDLAVDLTGRVCLVTGANSGIGKEAARALALRGAEVWLLCRSLERGGAAAEEIRREAGHDRVHLARLDVSEPDSVRAFVERFPGEHVHVLVNNAGVLPDERQETSGGIELTFATNVLGPWLLTHLLGAKLAKAAPSRVINVSSGGMYAVRLRADDTQWKKRAFDGVSAYAETKRAEVVLTELWAERLRREGVVVHAMHPGWADTPAVRSSLPRFHAVARAILRTPAEGADTVIWLACSEEAAGSTGRLWFDRRAQSPHWLPWTRESEADRRALWELCRELAGLDPAKDPAPA
jgi:NAD(P)-dependent dehydrogenase (short-subunit alcohol dehydrogenase family)